MGRVVKNIVTSLVATLCGLLALVVVLPPVLSVVVGIPAVQNAIVRRLTREASERIGVKVSVEQVRFRLFNRVELSGLCVEDCEGDTLLYARGVTAPVAALGIGRGPLSLGRVRLRGAELWLRKQSPEENMNITNVVSAISREPRNPDKRFTMHVEAVEADSLTFGLSRPYAERRRGGVDFGRFVLRRARVRISDLHVAGDTISMNIDALACTERGGLEVERLTARPLTVSRGAVTLDRAEIEAHGSRLSLPRVYLRGLERSWSSFRNFSDSVAMEIEMAPSRVTTDLVGAFVPAVAGWGVALEGAEVWTAGPLGSLSGGIRGARTMGATLAFDFTSRGLPDLSSAEVWAGNLELDTRGEDVAAMVRSVAGRELPARLGAALSRLGAITMRGGELSGTPRSPALKGTVGTDAGAVTFDLTAGTRGATTLGGRISTAGFDVGRLLDVDGPGALSGAFDVNVAVPRDSLARHRGADVAADVRGNLWGVNFAGRRYSDIALEGRLEGRLAEATLAVRDAALEADLGATMDGSGAVPRYTFELDVRRGDLAAMGVVHADSLARLSGRLAADLSGRRLDELGGTAELRGVAYRSSRGEVTTPLATLDVRATPEGGKRITLRSEFADGEVRSRTGYRDIAAYLGGFLQNYIPMPHPGGTAGELLPPDGGNPAAMTNYSIVSLDVKEASPLLEVVRPGSAVAPGSTARFMFNPYTGGFSLSARSDYVEWGGVLVEKVEVTGDNTRDSLKLHVAGSDIYSRRGHLSRLEVHGGARRGRARMEVSLDGRGWRLRADSVGFAGGRMALRNMVLLSADNPWQRLGATGVVSPLSSDTLRVRLESFDLSPLGTLLGRLGAGLEGRATGWLDVTSARGNPGTRADVRIEGLTVGGHTAPPLRLESRPEGGGARYSLTDERSGGRLVAGTLSAAGEIDARVNLPSLDAALLDPLLGTVLEATRGKASALVAVRGTPRRVRLDGHIDLEGLETTVAYTRARYGVEAARIAVENSILTLPPTPVTNARGGGGQISMRVDLSNPADVAAHLDARADRLVVFDTAGGEGRAFHGRVVATGTASIRTDRMGTAIDVAARTDEGTAFHLPLNSRSDVSWADFVTFTPQRTIADTVGVLARKRLDYRRRLAANATGEGARRVGLNLMASVTPAAEIHLVIDPALGPGITARGEGMIDLDVDPRAGRFTMTGDYNIASGRFELSMMEVFNKTFEIAPGSTLRWSGAPTDAALGVDASWRTRASLRPLMGEQGSSGRMVPVESIIRLRGSLSDPELTFDIALPSADTDQRQIAAGAMNTPELKSMQFLSLLTTGSFAEGNSITGQSSNAGVLAGGAVAFDILTGQLNNLLSSDDYDVFFRYRPQDDFSGSRMEAGFSTRLWGDRLELEVEGNYEDNRSATNVGLAGARDLTGEGSVTWVIDRAGNLRLRLFSRTIDRLNETQGMQENGLGIYLRRDFDRLRDIFRRRTRPLPPPAAAPPSPPLAAQEPKQEGESGAPGAKKSGE